MSMVKGDGPLFPFRPVAVSLALRAVSSAVFLTLFLGIPFMP